jgi:hypothetical protein
MKRGRGLIVLVLAGIAAVVVAVGAIAAGDSKGGKNVTVARGKFAHRTWSFAVQGRGRQRCYALTLNGPQESSSGGTCGPDRRPPLWSRVMGASDLNDSATIELDVTLNRVRSMRLKIGHPKSNRPDEWIHARNERMTRREAQKAGVRRDFRFAVLHSRGTLCVKQVKLFDRHGDRIKKMRVPCEF